MIVGLGNDIVEVERIALAWTRHGTRFAERILAPSELEQFAAVKEPARFLAKRFAAKEAAAKALGTGFREGVAFCDIAVVHSELGAPGIKWHGQALQRASALGVSRSWLTISDEHRFVVATVVLESL